MYVYDGGAKLPDAPEWPACSFICMLLCIAFSFAFGLVHAASALRVPMHTCFLPFNLVHPSTSSTVQSLGVAPFLPSPGCSAGFWLDNSNGTCQPCGYGAYCPGAKATAASATHIPCGRFKNTTGPYSRTDSQCSECTPSCAGDARECCPRFTMIVRLPLCFVGPRLTCIGVACSTPSYTLLQTLLLSPNRKFRCSIF